MPVQLEIGIAGAGSSDFATTPIPSVTLTKTPSGDILSSQYPIRSLVAPQRSSWGTLHVAAPIFEKRGWDVVAVVTKDEKLQIEALAEWQRNNPTTGLRLVDQVEETVPVDTQSRTLLSTSAPTWNSSYEVGFGVFTVVMLVDRSSFERYGAYREQKYIARFGMEEF